MNAAPAMDERVARLRPEELVELFDLVANARGGDRVIMDSHAIEWVYSALLELRELRGTYVSPKKGR